VSAAATIYVVDDDEAVRDSLQALLESHGYRVAAFASAEAFLASYRPGQPSCAIVDLRMPGMDGLALIERVLADGARLPMIMVTGHGDVPLAVKAMKAGARDFVEKPYANETILGAVAQAMETGVAPEADDVPAETAARIGALTPRERDVLEQLLVGHPNKIIAFELKISPRTVEIHRANLMKKMRADSLSQLVRMTIAAGGVRGR
jgi:two-component system response regulator FixJ